MFIYPYRADLAGMQFSNLWWSSTQGGLPRCWRMWRALVVKPKLYQTLEFWRSNWHFVSEDFQISIFIECSIRTKEACQPPKRHIAKGEGGDQKTWSLRLPSPKCFHHWCQTTTSTFLSYVRQIFQNVQTCPLKSITKHFLKPTANNKIRYL
jgi:hypothetical protein